jgi:hypothetical protein
MLVFGVILDGFSTLDQGKPFLCEYILVLSDNRLGRTAF